MASNTVTLTFAGDSKQLERAFGRVGLAAKSMTKDVEQSGSKLGAALKSASVAASGAAAVAGAGLGAVMATALAAALAGGLVLALGGGVLVAGILAAARDPGVSAAFGTLRTKASKAFENFGRPFQGPLTRAAETFGNAIERLAPMVNKVGEQLAPVVDKLAPALVKMAENALPALVGAAGQAGSAFGVLADVLPTVGTWIGKVVTSLSEFTAWAIRNRETIGAWISVLTPVVGVFLAVVAVIKVWIAVQTLLNVVLTLNPIGLIVIAVAALIAIIVLIATKTTFFQTLWETAWGGIKKAALNVWEWLKKLPEMIGNTFARIADFITAPFRAAFNFIATAWNNTIGKLSWTVPSWVPGVGGNTISAPQLPKFHQGGVMPGAPGTEGLALLQAGERVTPANGGGSTVVLEIHSDGSRAGEAIAALLRDVVRVRGGNVQSVLGATRG